MEKERVMNIFKRIRQLLENEKETNENHQKRIIEVSKIINDYYSKEEIILYDDVNSLSSQKDIKHL